MSTMRERFEAWWKGWPGTGDYEEQSCFAAWQSAEKQHWPPHPVSLPEGYEVASDEPVDVRSVEKDVLWWDGHTVCQGPATIADLFPCQMLCWPLRRVVKPAPKRIPLGPEDIGEWVRDPRFVNGSHWRVAAITSTGIMISYDELTYERLFDGWEHSTDRRNWSPCSKEA